MTRRFPHLLAAIARRPWALSEDWLGALVEVIGTRATGARLTDEQARDLAGSHSAVTGSITIAGQPTLNGIAAHFALDAAGTVIEARSRNVDAGAPEASVIAVIGIYGIISQRSAQVDDMSGPQGTSTERVARSLRQALADPAVKAIIFHHDSPGGSVNGVQELAAEILAARGQKPIIAQVDSLASSASYWLASVCDEVVVTPSGEVGSIGVYMMHRDVSAAAEDEGVKITLVSSTDSPFKVEGNPYEPLGDEARAYLLSQVNSFYGDFVGSVAKGRGTTVAKVKADFGKGRTLRAADAVKAGMADRVATMDETLKRVAKMKAPAGGKNRAEGERIEIAAADETGGDTRADAGGAEPTGDLKAADTSDLTEAEQRGSRIAAADQIGLLRRRLALR